MSSFFLAGLSLALIWPISPAFFADEVSAFSLGKIAVKSGFGDRFRAEVELKAKNFDGIAVTVGSELDYKNMGIEWRKIIAELRIKPPLLIRGNRRFAQVVSANPLFYPSFNLLLKAERATGPVFENYLITVDFQDSVSFKGVRGRGKSKGTLSEPPQKAAGAKPGSDRIAGKVLPGSGTLDPPAVVARNPTPLETVTINPPPVMKAFPKPAPKKDAKRDVAPRVDSGPFNAPLSGIPASSVGPFESKKYGPLKRGEDLEKISRALNYKPSVASRFAVALWMDNGGKFINGNIHRLKTGVTLEIGNLENRMKTLNSMQADQVIRDHWQEWQSAKRPTAPPKAEAPGPVAEALPDAIDDEALEELLLGIVDDWKDSWEKEDLDRHMALFHKGPDGSTAGRNRGFKRWRQFKKKMFARHDNVKINIQKPGLVRLKNKARVEFEQSFESDQMQSSGIKTIEFAQLGPEWKIVREDFKLKNIIHKAKATPPQADQAARDILRGGKPAQSQPAPPETQKTSPVTEALSETKDGEALEEKLLGIVDDWKDSWEKEDLDRHMALFHKGPDGSTAGRNRGFVYWRQFKKRMFARHDNVRINILNSSVVRLDGKASVEFEQSFESDQMQSSGIKTIEFAPSGSGWKIVREGFKLKNIIIKAKAAPSAQKARGSPLTGPKKPGLAIVVHASTLPDFSAATGLVKELRQMGFDAYSSPLYVSQTKKNYNVYVGRFAKMSLAQELAGSLKKFGGAQDAIPVKSPFVLQVGEHLQKADAEKQAMQLHAKGFPSYLFFVRKNKSSGPVTRVFTGTFAERKNAMRMAKELMGMGIISVVIRP